MKTLILYSTLGCHLCEQAESLFHDHRGSRQIKLEIIDIAGSDKLMRRYGVRIPVIRDPITEKEIGWPFDGKLLSKFLNSLSRRG